MKVKIQTIDMIGIIKKHFDKDLSYKMAFTNVELLIAVVSPSQSTRYPGSMCTTTLNEFATKDRGVATSKERSKNT